MTFDGCPRFLILSCIATIAAVGSSVLHRSAHAEPVEGVFSEKEGGQSTGNGGGGSIYEFEAIARDCITSLKRVSPTYLRRSLGKSELSAERVIEFLNQFEQDVNGSAQLSVSTTGSKLRRDGTDAEAGCEFGVDCFDAINSAGPPRSIRFSQSAWLGYGNNIVAKYGLVLHEYAGLSGIEINNYQSTTGLYRLILQIAEKRDPRTSDDLQGLGLGDYHTCALIDGNVSCWGLNSRGQIGDGSNELKTLRPQLVHGVPNRVRKLVAKHDHTVVLDEKGRVWWWGTLHSATWGDVASPMPVETRDTPKNITHLEGTAEGACVLTRDRGRVCFGGDGRFDSSALTNLRYGDPQHSIFCETESAQEVTCHLHVGFVAGGRKVKLPHPLISMPKGAIGHGYNHACAILADARAYCWGENPFGQLGNGKGHQSHSRFEEPTPVAKLGKVIQVAVGGAQSCAINQEGSVFCWGARLGLSKKERRGWNHDFRYTPVRISLPTSALKIWVGDHSACALLSNRDAFCWGKNTAGILGNGFDSFGSESPVRVRIN